MDNHNLFILIALAVWIPFGGFLFRASVAIHNQFTKIAKTFTSVEEPSYRKAMGVVVTVLFVSLAMWIGIGNFAADRKGRVPIASAGFLSALACGVLLVTAILLAKILPAGLKESFLITILFAVITGIALLLSFPFGKFLAAG